MKRLVSFQLICVCLGLFLATSDAVLPTEVHALTVFKEAIFDDPLLVLSNWNGLDSDPCNWVGVYCSDDHKHFWVFHKGIHSRRAVSALILARTVCLSYLQEHNKRSRFSSRNGHTCRILHGNNLIGSIPKEIGTLKHLKILDLGMNQLSGPIPSQIGDLVSYLQELRLDRNKLEGTVPGANSTDFASTMRGMYASNTTALGFCRATPLKIADFSYNYLVGSVPKCLEYLPKASFQGNCIKYKGITTRAPEQCGFTSTAIPRKPEGMKHRPEVDHKHKHKPHPSKLTWLLALEVVTGVIAGLVFLVALLMALHRCKEKPLSIIPWKKPGTDKDCMTIIVDTDMLKDVRRYSRRELEFACEDFSNIIGSSSDSIVYKGTMKGGPEIAVISLSNQEENWTSYLELYFQKEVADLARLNHQHIGKLLGYCIEDEQGCQLSWTRRMTIVIGIAKGLKYLHTEIDPPFTISELNSSAVYLTDDFSPKLVDFESWKTILTRSENNSRPISSEGAMCVQPCSLEARHLDIQGNIFAFGVLLLEIISGRPPISKDKGFLVDWAKDYLEDPEKMASVVDPALKHLREEDLEAIREVVTICIHVRPRDKVTMQEVCAMLERKLDISGSSELMASSLAWAELALSS
uniref:Protein kinase domain-containing protein n=1 Tax=Lactuca sativa TaxID=4236 RepID=A0A9R1XU20_LACSA|nr:hypothetical protein LSAT_V11C300104170 [Lactuca sativa]